MRNSQEYVDGMLAQARELAESLAGLQDEVRNLSVTADSADRLVSATVGPGGRLLNLTIDSRVYRDPDATALAATIVAVVERAQAAAERSELEIRSRALPDATALGGAVGVDVPELAELFAPAPAKKGRRDGTTRSR